MLRDMQQIQREVTCMDANKLKNKIIANGCTVSKTAELLGMHKSSLYRKLNGFEKFTINEAAKLKDILGLTDLEALAIFLTRW